MRALNAAARGVAAQGIREQREVSCVTEACPGLERQAEASILEADGDVASPAEKRSHGKGEMGLAGEGGSRRAGACELE